MPACVQTKSEKAMFMSSGQSLSFSMSHYDCDLDYAALLGLANGEFGEPSD
jgi:hypothetical protein